MCENSSPKWNRREKISTSFGSSSSSEDSRFFSWQVCLLTSCYLISLMPSMVLNGKSPYEMLYGRSLSVDHLCVFGCFCYVTNLGNKDTLASRSTKTVFIGYSRLKKVTSYWISRLRAYLLTNIWCLKSIFFHSKWIQYHWICLMMKECSHLMNRRGSNWW